MEPIVFRQGDDRPSLQFRVYDQDNEVFVDLSDSTTKVYAKFRAQNSSTVLETVECTKIDGGLHGMVRMDWPADALDVDEGRYEIEVYVSWDGDIQTVGRYYLLGYSYDDDGVLPIKVKEDF